MLSLLRRSAGRIWRMCAAVAVVLIGFQLSLMAAAVSLQESGDFQRLVAAVPAFVRETVGPALGSFAGMTVLAYFEPAILLGLSLFAIYVATEPAGDVESGIVDLVLARPLSRHALITRSLILTVAVIAGVVAIMGAANWLTLAWMAPDGAVWPERRVVLLMMAHLAAVLWCFGGVALGLSAGLARRSAAVGVMALVLVSMYMVHAVEEFTTRFDGVGWMSPFHYFQGTTVLLGTAPLLRNFSVLLGIGVAGVAVAYVQFARRDL